MSTVYCRQCGHQISDSDAFCAQCGAKQAQQDSRRPKRQWTASILGSASILLVGSLMDYPYSIIAMILMGCLLLIWFGLDQTNRTR